jgi:hypothetical protein
VRRGLLPVAVGVVLAGCVGGGAQTAAPVASEPGGGSALANLFRFGTTEPPPPLPENQDELPCPFVSIVPGGAAVRLGGQTSESVRSQITITDVARECVTQPGATALTMRVGAEGRVLIGPAGGAGGQFATLRIEVRRGDQVIASRTARVGGAVPSGQASTGWVHVEQGLTIPANLLLARGDTDVFVTLNPGAEPRARRR